MTIQKSLNQSQKEMNSNTASTDWRTTWPYGFHLIEETIQSVCEKNESAIDGQVDGSHYKDMKIQPLYFCEINKLSACESKAIKYICRHRKKGKRKDLEKAIHCLKYLIELEYPDDAK